MAVARFQVFSSGTRMPAGMDVGADWHTVTWRFMSANNRDLGHAARSFPDVASCCAAVQQLCDTLGAAVCVTVRDGPRHWAWRIRVDGVDHVVSSRRYERRVEARNSCRAFLGLVRDADSLDLCQFVRFP